MLRTVVKLLLMAPLLLPQGVCVCAWATPAPAAASAAPSAPTTHAPRCCCHHHAHTATATPVETCVPGAMTDWPAESDEHAPACPASKVEWQALIAGAPHSLLSQALGVSLPELFLTCAAETLLGSLDAPVPAAQPLYLSLLNLRI